MPIIEKIIEKARIWEILVPINREFSKKHYKKWFKNIKTNQIELIHKPLVSDNLYKSKIDIDLPIRVLCTKNKIDELAAFSLDHFNRPNILYYNVGTEFTIVRK